MGVMVSSTFTDLKEHRAALIKAIEGQGLKAVVMENDSAKPAVDVIDSSLQMVRDGSAYIGVISHKYGQTPACQTRNSRKLSLSELEFNEAQRLGRPILLFIMSEDHPVRKGDVETSGAKRKKLNAFRERAKQMKLDSRVHRVYATFDSLEDFNAKAIHSVAALHRYLDEVAQSSPPALPLLTPTPPDPIPAPPAFYAEPPYIGSHKFTGRAAQLEVLNDWTVAADPHPVLLFDAIGGSGKSMFTWEWATKYASKIRQDWAGRFWYSFYEKGGVMSDFCQRALAYMTGRPLEEFRKKKTPELAEQLIHHLRTRPWLIVLDGLERVLVHYHRIDAAELPEEATNQPTDQIAQRDPCAAIRPEDDDLLRALAAAAPSKLLFTTRLVPRVFLNPASQPVPGVLRVSLPGLRPADAEELLRSCGVTGDSQAIQHFLKSQCDCHPLVTGILAGLINDHLPSKGDFDAWVIDSAGGGQLNLADLDLVQKRNHILKAALNAIPGKGRELLSTLALVSEGIDYSMLNAFNPHLPPEPKPVVKPWNPELAPWWKEVSDAEKKGILRQYQAAIKRRTEYDQAVEVWRKSPEFQAALQQLTQTVHDLERRGLLQYDHHSKRYDLHPVVRGVAVGGLKHLETERYGQRVMDYFSRQAHRPYVQAETLEDLRPGLHIVRMLLKMGRLREAYYAYQGDLAQALKFNVEADAECLSLMRPFFPKGWAVPPDGFPERSQSYLANEAGIALRGMGQWKGALEAFGVALLTDLRQKDWENVRTDLCNITYVLSSRAKTQRYLAFAFDIATLTKDAAGVFVTGLDLYRAFCEQGQWGKADKIWSLLDSMGRSWPRHVYRPGTAEHAHAQYDFYRGRLKEKDLVCAERLAKENKNRGGLRDVIALRGQWRLEQGQWALAAESLREAVRMARQVGETNAAAETRLALAKFHLKQLHNPGHVAKQLSEARKISHRPLAELWFAIGDHDRAKKHVLRAYESAWADGEPHVDRYELAKATTLLKQLGTEIPKLPPYDPNKDEKLPWEDVVAVAIEKLRRTLQEAKPPPKLRRKH
jgi:tetratricopeptide (TPR) repeat protein